MYGMEYMERKDMKSTKTIQIGEEEKYELYSDVSPLSLRQS